ncbi:hypothetical protein VM1G_00155 [Cytospora mali]|uniref:Uncharacterized protein n=1 Tax=Cytospora mali TaxID=578113 RepID=A0A194VNN0_CYTMA|nr:hypothetical protein VM1G_00155 [Valsa mali]
MTLLPSEPVEYGFLSSPNFPKPPPDNLNIYELGPNDLEDYFIGKIHRKRGETLAKQDLKHVPMDVGLLSTLDQLVVYNPIKDCLYKYRVEEVPKEAVGELEGLANAQDFGIGCFEQLCEVLRKKIQATAISENPEEDFGEGVEGAVAMLARLSLQVFPSVGSDHTKATNAKVHVVIVDGLGESHRYSHVLRPDVDLKSFLEEMDQKFPKYCDPYDQEAYKNWDARIQHLKNIGLDGNPTLDRIEGLVSLHQATENQDLPQWMYYIIREGGSSEELDIQDESSFQTMVDRAAKQDSPACLMRISEAKFRNIFVELRFLEEKQFASTRDNARIQDNDDHQHELQQPDEDVEENDEGGSDDPFFDPEPFWAHNRLTYFYDLDHNNPKHFEGQQQDD